MLELAITVAMIVGSIALFLYWFRYTCVLILRAETAHDYASQLVTSKGLQFLAVQAQVSTANAQDLNRLHQALDQDYATIQSLLASATAAQMDLQDHMVRVYYHAVMIWYATSRTLSTTAARHALDEMTDVIAHFANVAGQAAAAA